MKEIVHVAVRAAQEAGAFLLENYGRIGSIEHKGDRNLVTNVDKQAQSIIVDRIRAAFPGHGILAEEDGLAQTDKEYTWVVDPLDGTHNYVRNIPLFGVSIGIAHLGVYVAGVIFMPCAGELYVAESGAGAFKNEARIRVSGIGELKEASLSFDSGIRYHPRQLLPLLGEVADKSFNVRMFGSSARNLSYVAEGVLDAAIEFEDQPWDSAAGVCLVQEAGGVVKAFDGSPMTVTTKGYVASNGLLQSGLEAMVRKATLTP
jgi:myo-inositol-1(or 4)-monophosphatase